MSYINLVQYLGSFGGILFVPHFFRTSPIATFVAIPLMYLIISKKLNSKQFRLQDIVHGLPALLYTINYAPVFFKSASYKQALISKLLIMKDYYNYNEGWLFKSDTFNAMRMIQIGLYVILSAFLIYKFKKVKMNMTFLKILLYWYFGYMVSLLTPSILFLLGILPKVGFLTVPSVYFLITLVFLIIFFFNYNLIYKRAFNLEERGIPENTPKEQLKFLTNVDDVNHKELIKITKIEDYLNEFKPYLNEDFSLGNLEREIGISSKRISLSIKKRYNLNFAQYINKLRVNYFTSKLLEDEKLRNYTIEDLSLKFGFSSPNSFYHYFKYYTGQTPRKFLDDICKDLNKKGA
ncbi:MAG: helix-turn-helix domain-containing protein [Candidatus Magasanikbacteria bacterium]|nr:helix-turn-helix domain-containing protein [Candidatus Magasanikbacteria bacterium]